MKLNPKEVRDGQYWLLGAGAFAIVFSLFLQYVDHSLTTSQSEKVLGDTLYELRMAQSTVSAAATDPRQTTPFLAEQNIAFHKNSRSLRAVTTHDSHDAHGHDTHVHDGHGDDAHNESAEGGH